MLDSDLKKQLEEVFAPIDKDIELVVDLSQHPDQGELLNLLEGVSEAHPRIKVTKAISGPGSSSPIPRFRIKSNGQPTGITFSGIPGGHEFSSLVLGILNSSGKGKMPDPVLAERIKRLKGPVRVKTYISLSCENCPDVVQALNQMALINENFQHEMIDGAYVPDEIAALNIQGVPSVVADNKLISSGRVTLIDLIAKLEQHFGTEESPVKSTRDLGKVDVAVIGGGPAGVSAAIYTVRKGLTTALIAERIGGQVQETKGIENLIGVTYTEGPQLASQLAQHASTYPIQMLEHRRVKHISKEPGPKIIEFESGEKLYANAVIVSTGAKWRELSVPGEKEYIGRGVAFCPHCDGPFYKGKKVAVIGGGNSGVEAAIDLAGIVREVVIFEFNPELKADSVLVNKLRSLPNVSIVTNAKTEEIRGDGQKVTGLSYVDRNSNEKLNLDLDGVFVQIGLIPNSQFLKGVVELSPFGEVIVDEKGRSSTPGIYAAGDVTTTPYKQIIIAMGEGAKTALAVFEDRMKA